MKRNLIQCFTVLLMLGLLLNPVFGWFYNDQPPVASNLKYEKFGPRCDRLLIRLYSGASGEWEALKTTPQEIDVTDWPLSEDYYLEFLGPYNTTVNVVAMGGEFGIRNLDMNQNPNRYLGAPQDPDYPNPKKNLNDSDPSNDYNPTSDLNMRKAILSCLDRSAYVAYIGSMAAKELWCALPPLTGSQYYNDTYMKNAYPFSTVNAIAWLNNATHPFRINAGTGYRYWDLDDDSTEDANEWVELDFVIRSDDPSRLYAGDQIADRLDDCDVRVYRNYLTITGARARWMTAKNAHLYTAGWSLGSTPDSITLWQGDAGIGTAYCYYWHPGQCYDTPYANDAEFNIASRHVEIANSFSEAEVNMEICNRRMAEAALNGPMFVYDSAQACARKYSGGPNPQNPTEAPYIGDYWDGMHMITGYGLDYGQTYLNAHPRGHNTAPNNGTIRYGMKTTDIRAYNSIYAEWVWDNRILDQIYDTAIGTNPYNLNDYINWMCANYTVGTYPHPALGTCTKVTFTIRPDLYWSDGVPITAADVYFTLVELKSILKSRHLPNPWWYSAVSAILSFSIIDPYTYEVLINVKSIWAFGLTGSGVRILPEHIWRDIVTTGDPQQATPDLNMISSGPWRLRYYNSFDSVELVSNTAGRTVQITGSNFSGSTPTTNPYGYFRYNPLDVDLTLDGAYVHKMTPSAHTFKVTLLNEWFGGSVNATTTVKLLCQNGTLVTLANADDDTITACTQVGVNHVPGKLEKSFAVNVGWGKYMVQVRSIITDPEDWLGKEKWFNATYWFTIPEDVAGEETWFGLPMPDTVVELVDLARVSAAFGSYPGKSNWDAVCDIGGELGYVPDYAIEIIDLAMISARYGWAFGVQG